MHHICVGKLCDWRYTFGMRGIYIMNALRSVLWMGVILEFTLRLRPRLFIHLFMNPAFLFYGACICS